MNDSIVFELDFQGLGLGNFQKRESKFLEVEQKVHQSVCHDFLTALAAGVLTVLYLGASDGPALRSRCRRVENVAIYMTW